MSFQFIIPVVKKWQKLFRVTENSDMLQSGDLSYTPAKFYYAVAEVVNSGAAQDLTLTINGYEPSGAKVTDGAFGAVALGVIYTVQAGRNWIELTFLNNAYLGGAGAGSYGAVFFRCTSYSGAHFTEGMVKQFFNPGFDWGIFQFELKMAADMHYLSSMDVYLGGY